MDEIGDMLTLFNTFKEVTKILSAAEHPTIHLAAPVSGKLLEHFAGPCPSSHPEVVALRKQIFLIAKADLVQVLTYKVAVSFNPAVKHMPVLSIEGKKSSGKLRPK